jgi:hypothetical protein
MVGSSKEWLRGNKDEEVEVKGNFPTAKIPVNIATKLQGGKTEELWFDSQQRQDTVSLTRSVQSFVIFLYIK